MKIEYCDRYTPETCRANPEKIFVFGCNLAGWGTAGQACIRKEPNAFGIPTKRYPSMETGAFFTDRECERNHVLTALRELYTLGRTHTIVFPSKGLGTGMAKMNTSSPKLYAEMTDIMQKHFGARNGS